MHFPRLFAAIVIAAWAVTTVDTSSVLAPVLSRPRETFRVIPDLYQDPFGMAATDMGDDEVNRFCELMYEAPDYIRQGIEHDEDEPRPELDWRLRKGESLEECQERLMKDLKYTNQDRFNYIFYEMFFPKFMEKKRLKAYHLGKPLNPHYVRVFSECEKKEIPYSPELRSFLGTHKSIREYMEARKVLSPLHDPERSPQHRFWHACQTGAADEEIYSLAERANINARDETYFNFSGLDFAIERNHSGAAEVLLSLDADHNSVNGFNLTALDFAFFAQNRRVKDAIRFTTMLQRRRLEFESEMNSILHPKKSEEYRDRELYGVGHENPFEHNAFLPYLIPE